MISYTTLSANECKDWALTRIPTQSLHFQTEWEDSSDTHSKHQRSRRRPGEKNNCCRHFARIGGHKYISLFPFPAPTPPSSPFLAFPFLISVGIMYPMEQCSIRWGNASVGMLVLTCMATPDTAPIVHVGNGQTVWATQTQHADRQKDRHTHAHTPIGGGGVCSVRSTTATTTTAEKKTSACQACGKPHASCGTKIEVKETSHVFVLRLNWNCTALWLLKVY